MTPPGPERADLVDLASDSVIAVACDGRILTWNRVAAATYGWSVEQAVGSDFEALVSAPGFSPSPRAYTRLAAEGVWLGRLKRVLREGAEIVAHVRWTMTVDGEGRPDGFVEFSAPDDTDDDVAVLKASEARYRQLFFRAPVALMLDDPRRVAGIVAELEAIGVADIDLYLDAHPEFLEQAIDRIELSQVNDHALELFGARSAEELLGPVGHMWVDAPQTFRHALVARYRGAAAFSEETRIRTLDGRTVDVLFSLAFAEPGSEAESSLNGMRDITARRQAEARLRKVTSDFTHAARLSTLGELTTSIAHEVKQPLSAILTSAQTALRWMARDVPDVDRAIGLSTRIVEQAQRASDIIGRIQEMAGKREDRPVRLDLNAVIAESLVFIRQEIDDKAVALAVELDPGLPPIFGDRVQLQQVIVNLIVNGIQALKTVDPRRREIRIGTLHSRQDGVIMTITDTGPGIAAQDRDRVFDSFFTTKTGGLGIGLAICRSIIAAHGGTVTACEGDTGGAVFRVTLPVLAPGENDETAP